MLLHLCIVVFTDVGVSVSVTFVVSFSLGVLVVSVLCYISRKSKHFYRPSATYKIADDAIEMDKNLSYVILK